MNDDRLTSEEIAEIREWLNLDARLVPHPRVMLNIEDALDGYESLLAENEALRKDGERLRKIVADDYLMDDCRCPACKAVREWDAHRAQSGDTE